jgi:phosphoribosylformylglycinamidine synthase
MREEELIRAVASGVGNPIIAVGARTGRDGIHGASFASEDLSHESDAKRPRVQVGDPFTEKLLLEASLELIRSGHIVAIQDMGAAGLTSSSAEMAARGDVGVEIDVTRMPLREEGMSPYEILLSESQERMLVVALKGREAQVQAILAKWDLAAEVIGEVIAEPVYRVKEGDRVVAEFPGSRLVTDCPVYHPEARESDAIRALRERDVSSIAERLEETDPMWTLERLLASPTIASKSWIVRQYDSTVRASTVVGPGPADAAVVMLRGTRRALALKTDCNGRYVYLDPREGGRIAVAEAARNVACAGGRPMAITNCLNFGNPRKPDVFFQFREAVAGMGEACQALGTPVTGGNVSFYNESPTGAVYPTPTIGMVGLLDDVEHATTAVFRTTGNSIILLGENTGDIGASEYLRWIHDVVAGRPPACDLQAEARLIEALLEAMADGTVASAHDCSDGGLAVALAECCLMDEDAPRGASVDLTRWSALPLRVLLFGETQGRAIVSTPDPAAVLAIAARHGVPGVEIGTVGEIGGSVVVTVGKQRFESPVSRLAAAYHGAVPAMMSKVATATDEDEPALAGRSS